jgi:hypothetical protein
MVSYINKVVSGSLLLCLFALLSLLTSCDNISESERLIYVKPAAAKRVVLLEDFTGQRCVNCPRATDVIEQLQDSLGDALVAVGIHGGPLGVHATPTVNGLATDLGDEYYNHWHLEFQPVGLVNRHGAVNYGDWATEVMKELAREAPMQLTAAAIYNEHDSIDIDIIATGTDGTTTGKLQLWLLEDSITAIQMMPDGSRNTAYVHNHVLRRAVNGSWGDDFTVNEGKDLNRHYSVKPEDAWRRDQLSVVAFVYNDSGVQQAIKVKVKSEK